MTDGPAFKDHFSGHAGDYARFRPGYPDELFDWLAAVAPGRKLAWDAGTGNGQAARGLASRFARVHATDASAEQVAHAEAPDNVLFACEPAESSSLPDGTVDLVTAGQAFHWFDPDAFHAEVDRVLRPGGVLAAWTYQLNVIDPAVDDVVLDFYQRIVGDYWPPERVHVETAYRDLTFPWPEIDMPSLHLAREMELGAYLDYLGTWSAVRRFRAATGNDPLPELRDRLERPWGDAGRRTVRWPLALRAGRKPA